MTPKNLGHALNHVFLSYKRVESMTVVIRHFDLKRLSMRVSQKRLIWVDGVKYPCESCTSSRPLYCWWCGSNSINFLSRRREVGVTELIPPMGIT